MKDKVNKTINTDYDAITLINSFQSQVQWFVIMMDGLKDKRSGFKRIEFSGSWSWWLFEKQEVKIRESSSMLHDHGGWFRRQKVKTQECQGKWFMVMMAGWDNKKPRLKRVNFNDSWWVVEKTKGQDSWQSSLVVHGHGVRWRQEVKTPESQVQWFMVGVWRLFV